MFRIVLARQGQTMEKGTLVRWCKNEGDEFAIGEDLYEIETEKVVVAIQATRPGRLVKAVAAVDDELPVGALLAIAGEKNEQISNPQVESLIRSSTAEPATGATANESPELIASRSNQITALPKARALAKELNVDLSLIVGSGEQGAITPEDVRLAARQRPAQPLHSPMPELDPAKSATPPTAIRRMALSPIGRSIGRALERGMLVPQFSQGILIDATELVRRKDGAQDLTYTDLFLDAIVKAAKEVPDVLSRGSERDIHFFAGVDVSIVTATDSGLLLAVLRNAGAMTISQRAPAWRALADRARNGQLSPEESSAGLIALSNLGSRGVDYGTALLPVEHSAIVFFGSLRNRAIAIGDTVEARPTIHVSITYDHRVIDGILGARFTAAIRSALEGG
jgi:pyruvate dehydrogenase E2 component (dihydrolipoyllysine-residue acetyltransferase)